MNELDLFRRFRSGVAAPSEHAKQRASEQLTASIEGERRPRKRILRLIRRHPGRAGLVFATVVAVTAAALFVSNPWKTAPGLGFLEEVQAALTPPSGTVLHFKVVVAGTYGRKCTYKHPPIEYWVDQTPPYKYRAFEVNQPDPCKAGASIEIGGEAASRRPTFMLLSPNMLTNVGRWPIPDTGPDWVAGLRQEIDDGTAHHAGRTVLDGRPVERIRIDCIHAKFPKCDPVVAYVDPKSLKPVRVEDGGGLSYWDFVKYEYLPGTPANRALADIREQHPDATLATGEEQP